MSARWEIPPGHALVEEDVGQGKSSRVSVVRRNSDGALFAWKVPNGGNAGNGDVLDLLVDRSREWQELGIATGDVTFAPDGKTLLQPWVEGPTLRTLFRDTSLLRDPDDPHLPPLAELFRRIVTARVFVSGLNAANLIFCGDRFLVIDSGAVRRVRSVYAAWRRQRKKLALHWVRFDGHANQTIERFVDRLEALMALPRPSPWDRCRYLFSRR